MSEKFIKAQCGKTGRYFGLRIEDADGQPRCTDFYNMTTEQGKMTASTIDVPNLQSAPNLQACPRCGQRKAAGCSCPSQLYGCSTHAPADYRFPCLYCNQLHLFSMDEGNELTDSSMVGTTVRLAQGQEIVISAAGSAALEHILVGVGWDIAQDGNRMDLDSSVVMRGTGSTNLIFFGNLSDTAGSIVHNGDNLTGGKMNGNPNGDSENINIYLRKVPDSYSTLYIVLNIYRATERHQTLKTVRNMYIRLYNGKNHKVLAEYYVDKSNENMNAIVIGKVYRTGNAWKLQALGKAIRVDNVHEFETMTLD